jgi:hypothetical protein
MISRRKLFLAATATGIGAAGFGLYHYGDPVAEVVTQNLGNPPAAWVEGRP